MTVSEKFPCVLLRASSLLRLLARGVPAPQAIKILKDDWKSTIINIRNLVGKKEIFVQRRQRLLGRALKKLEMITNCYILVQGRTVRSCDGFFFSWYQTSPKLCGTKHAEHAASFRPYKRSCAASRESNEKGGGT
ncbi:KRR1 small subunit processome component-like [Eutrema salsugineum]|uniref:KRR1 small subunit processome component-like n=1 Tax=Eutrema salsugineum TaxID=72664 RepID=UPI000CED44E7|nr:KRR1 small subunit processome component-like [Eutrema salsugineum]